MDNKELENRIIKSLGFLQVYLEFYKKNDKFWRVKVIIELLNNTLITFQDLYKAWKNKIDNYL